MTNDTLSVIKRRRSIRAFAQRQIPDDLRDAVVNAGLFAPNAGGESWHVTVIQNRELLERMNTLAKQAAAQSALPWLAELGKDPAFHSLYHAPTLILVSCEESVYAVYDASAATQTLLLAAESLDLGACWGYFVTQAFQSPEGDALRKELQIPQGYQVYTSVALGFKAEQSPAAPERKTGLITYIP